MRLVVLLCVVVMGTGLRAQTPAALPVYDVVSVKPNSTGSGNMSFNTSENSFSAVNITMGMLLEYTFEIRRDLIEGLHGPAESARFDLEGKVSDADPEAMEKVTEDQRRAMLAPVLAERFALKTHRETKMLPIYELVLAKDGTKLKPLPPKGTPEEGVEKLGLGDVNWGSTRIVGHAIPMSTVAHTLADVLKRTVIDKTGLEGLYDVTLRWTPDTATTDEQALGSIFTALQEQLGLKLRPAKGPVEMLVVDHVQMPSEN